eukprot:978381-Rhodomonas_salina.1
MASFLPCSGPSAARGVCRAGRAARAAAPPCASRSWPWALRGAGLPRRPPALRPACSAPAPSPPPRRHPLTLAGCAAKRAKLGRICGRRRRRRRR